MPTTHSSRTAIDADVTLTELHEAIGDLEHRRRAATDPQERERLDRASAHLCALAADRKEHLEALVGQVQEVLDHADEALLMDLAVRAVRAQRSAEALTRLSVEVHQQRAQLAADGR